MIDSLRAFQSRGFGRAHLSWDLRPVLKLIISRLLQGVLVLVFVSALTFALLAAAGGDALTALRNDPLVSERTLEEQRRIYGLDRPIHVRYARWLIGVA